MGFEPGSSSEFLLEFGTRSKPLGHHGRFFSCSYAREKKRKTRFCFHFQIGTEKKSKNLGRPRKKRPNEAEEEDDDVYDPSILPLPTNSQKPSTYEQSGLEIQMLRNERHSKSECFYIPISKGFVSE